MGYRAMHLKIRLKNELNVTRDQVYDVVTDIDLEGLRQRQPRFKQKRKKAHLLQLDQIGLDLWTVTIN